MHAPQEERLKPLMMTVAVGLGLIVPALQAQAADEPLTRDQVWDCISYGDDILRARERMDDYQRMKRHAKKRYNETTNQQYRRELAREHDRYVDRYNSNVEDYNENLLPRYNKRCVAKSLAVSDYEAVCNTRARMDNPFCKSFRDLRREVMRKKGWK